MDNLQWFLLLVVLLGGWFGKSAVGRAVLIIKKILQFVVTIKADVLAALTKSNINPDVVAGIKKLFEVIEFVLQIDRTALAKRETLDTISGDLEAVKRLTNGH